MFIIAKANDTGRIRFVTSIKGGGRSIETGHYSDLDMHDLRNCARQFKNRETAQKARDAMEELGGYDDYVVCAIDEMPAYAPGRSDWVR